MKKLNELIKDETKRWLTKVILAYRQSSSDVPKTLPSSAGESANLWLEREYRKHPPQKMESCAIAYWAALRMPNPVPWVNRLALAQYARGTRTLEEDVRDPLAESLEEIYQQRKTPSVLVVFTRLHMDGAYQTVLDAVRFPLFFREPVAFALTLPSRSPVLSGRIVFPPEWKIFTEDLLWELSSDLEQYDAAYQTYKYLQKYPSATHNREVRFLVRYFGAVLDRAKRTTK